jgi:hypothetical protein
MCETNDIIYWNYFPLFNPKSVEQMQKLITLHLNVTIIPCYSQGEFHARLSCYDMRKICRVVFVPCFCAKFKIISLYNYCMQRK